jgi:hypothetical protein
VEGDGGVPDVGSVVAVPRLSCESRLFSTFRFHIWSYSLVSMHFQCGGLALFEASLLVRGEVGHTGPAMLFV